MDHLARIGDLLAHLIATTVAVGGATPGRVKPARRPEGAVVRLRRDDRISEHRKVAAILLRPDPPTE